MDTSELEIRNAARRAVETTGLRKVARQIEMSPAGLLKFLRGSNPHPATWGKLRAWYARDGLEQVGVAPEAAPVALGLLLQHLAPDLRSRAEVEIVEVIGRLYGGAGLAAPAWLLELKGTPAGYTQGRDTRRQHFATVELIRGTSFVLQQQPFEGDPRSVVEAIGSTRGVWHDEVFHPFHRVSRIRLDGRAKS